MEREPCHRGTEWLAQQAILFLSRGLHPGQQRYISRSRRSVSRPEKGFHQRGQIRIEIVTPLLRRRGQPIGEAGRNRHGQLLHLGGGGWRKRHETQWRVGVSRSWDEEAIG